MVNTKKLPRHLTEEEVHRMFEAARKSSPYRDLLILKMLYYFGLRNNEMCFMDVVHIDLISKKIKIVGSDRSAGKKGAKGGKDRYVPIIDINPLPGERKTILDDLKEWKHGRTSGLLINGDSKDGSISDRTVRRIVKSCAEIARVPGWEEIHPHTLRHSYATHLKNIGVPLEVIQGLLGHVRADTTQIYAHMGIENLRKEVEKYVWITKYRESILDTLKSIESEKDPLVRLEKRVSILIDLLLADNGILSRQ